MGSLFRLAIIGSIAFGLYSLYLSPQYRPQIDAALERLLERFTKLEEEINRQIGFGSTSTLDPKNVAVVVPRSKAQDWQTVGSLGGSILGGTQRIKVEVDFTQNSKPNQSDLNVISVVLQKYSGKQVSTSLDSSNLEVKEDYTLQDVVELTKANRSCYTSSSQVCIYFLFLPGSFEGSNALGATFTSSAAALFSEQLHRAGSPLASREKIAQATITHELGHLFGLVNLSYKSPRDHEDPSHPGHSKNQNSVMYWAVEDISIGTILRGGPPTNFDVDDEADIAQIKEGR